MLRFGLDEPGNSNSVKPIPGKRLRKWHEKFKNTRWWIFRLMKIVVYIILQARSWWFYSRKNSRVPLHALHTFHASFPNHMIDQNHFWLLCHPTKAIPSIARHILLPSGFFSRGSKTINAIGSRGNLYLLQFLGSAEEMPGQRRTPCRLRYWERASC